MLQKTRGVSLRMCAQGGALAFTSWLLCPDHRAARKARPARQGYPGARAGGRIETKPAWSFPTWGVNYPPGGQGPPERISWSHGISFAAQGCLNCWLLSGANASERAKQWPAPRRCSLAGHEVTECPRVVGLARLSPSGSSRRGWVSLVAWDILFPCRETRTAVCGSGHTRLRW